MGKGNGEKRNEEKQKGVRREGRCSPVPQPWLFPAQSPPCGQALGCVSLCPASAPNDPAQHEERLDPLLPHHHHQ